MLVDLGQIVTGTGLQTDEFVFSQDGSLLRYRVGAGNSIDIDQYAADGTFLGHETYTDTNIFGFTFLPVDMVRLSDGRYAGVFWAGPGGQQAYARIFDAEGHALTDYIEVDPGSVSPSFNISLQAAPHGGFSVVIGDDRSVSTTTEVTLVEFDAQGDVLNAVVVSQEADPVTGGDGHQTAYQHAVLPDGSFAIGYVSAVFDIHPVTNTPIEGYGVRVSYVSTTGEVTGTETIYHPLIGASSFINNADALVMGYAASTVAFADGSIAVMYPRDAGDGGGALRWYASFGGAPVDLTSGGGISAFARYPIFMALPDGSIAALTDDALNAVDRVPKLIIFDETGILQTFEFDQITLPQGRPSWDGMELAEDGALVLTLSTGDVHRFGFNDNALDLPDDPATAVSGNRFANSVFGDAEDRSILLRQGNDVAYGGTGDETINGAGGRDHLEGGVGNDTLIGSAGQDTLLGGAGRDTLFGGQHVDRLIGGGANDDLFGGGHDDTLFGNDGNDDLFGDGGNDTLRGGTGRDLLDGGRGNDDLFGDGDVDTFVYNGGRDVIHDHETGETIRIDMAALGVAYGTVAEMLDDVALLRADGILLRFSPAARLEIAGSYASVDDLAPEFVLI